jgi:phage terminase large subunit-like protein
MRMVDNIANLSPHMVARLTARYEGTTLGRQELEGEVLTEVEGALWSTTLIERNRLSWPDGTDHESRMAWARLRRVIVGVDPPGGATEAGIVVAASTSHCPCGGPRQPHALVLDDVSGRGSPDEWGTAAVEAYRRWRADRLVGEVNYGGDMVEKVVRSVDRSVSYKPVRATRGKAVRAEPIVALYEQGRVHHVGVFGDLESEQTTWRPDDSWSPNRLDALVWAVTELELQTAGTAQLTGGQLSGLRLGVR